MNTEKRYGVWAGNPKGEAYDPTRCAKAVFGSLVWADHQCTRKNGHGKDGLYCKQHARVQGGAK